MRFSTVFYEEHKYTDLLGVLVLALVFVVIYSHGLRGLYRSDSAGTYERTVTNTITEKTVYVITSEKFIQAVLSGAAFGIINRSVGIITFVFVGMAYTLLGVNTPPQLYGLPIVLLVFAAAWWADEHVEWFRSWIHEETGAEPADDDPPEESDGTGETDT